MSALHKRPSRLATAAVRTLGASLVAVGVTVAAVTAVDLLHGSGPGDPAVRAAATAAPARPAPAARSTPPAPQPAPAPAEAAPAAPPVPAAAQPAPAPAAPRVALVVYNAAGIANLAQQAAQRLTDAGYQVIRTRDLRSVLPDTTVFYDPGGATQAQTLVDAHLGVARALPRPRWLLPTGTLIVLLRPDYAGA